MQESESIALVLNEDFWLRLYISGYSSKKKDSLYLNTHNAVS